MRKTKILLISLILILGGMFLGSVNAVNLKAQLERPFTPAEYQYGVDGEIQGNMLYYTIVKIFEENDALYSRPFYCLRGGVGFGSNDVNTQEKISYTELAEMHTNAKEVIEKYKELYNVDLDRVEEIDGKEVNLYNAILWVLDESYLPKDIVKGQKTVYNAAKYKGELLGKAGVPTTGITDDDLEAIQQLAVWYFANYDEQKSGINPTVSQSTMNPANFLKINGNDNISRASNLNKIYQYLVNGAIDNAGTIDNEITYKINRTTGARTRIIKTNKFDKTTLTIESKNISVPGMPIGPNSFYKIGPFKIESDVNSRTAEKTIDATSIVLYDANGKKVEREYTLPDSTTSSIYRIIDDTGAEVEELKDGIDYYVQFLKPFQKGITILSFITEEEKYDVASKVKLEITSTYTKSEANFLYATQNSSDNQAVVEIVKEKVSVNDVITTECYDLSLRKFIASINGNTKNREPKIYLENLNENDSRTNEKITTARYVHPKNSLQVETGDKVIYTIRVYNEGELDGKALEITDYLPEGLQLVSYTEGDGSINDIYGWQIDGNKITTEHLKDTTIKAYDPSKTTEEEGWQKSEDINSGLYYADVQVECEVIAQISSENQNLRNIAEISNDDGNDRDSTPNNVDLGDYNPQGDNSQYQEDDDDYEDLIIKAKEFDLSLRKFITKIQRDDEEINLTTSREPSIKIEGLKAGADTAKYVHPKNTLFLKRGDIITYTIRVYNEGELSGYVLEVKDYLPEGLELVEGQNDIWTIEGNTLTTDELKDQLLLGYDKDATSVAEGVKWQKASDDESGLYYYDLTVVCKIKDTVSDGTILKNVAEISSDRSEPIDINDRDSEPGNVYQDQAHNPGAENDGYTPGEQDDDDFETVIVEADEVFDLALRKYIVGVKISEDNVLNLPTKEPNVSIVPLNQGEPTADYKHRKDPVEVEIGNIVTYRFTVYNEGEIDGNVYSITDYLPEGLIFDVESNPGFIEYKEEYTEEELTGKEYAYKIEGNKITILPLNEDNLFELVAFNGSALDSKSIDVKFKVTASQTNNDQVLTNVATMIYGAKGLDIADRDSNITGEEFTVPTAEKLLEGLPGYKGNQSNKDDLTDSTYHYKGQQDDDDFEKIIIKGIPFDLSLRKFTTSVKRNGQEILNADRTPSIDTTTLINGTFNRNGVLEYTATYNHSKDPVVVRQGDIITYTLRIYNEGERDGYATEIKDYIPEGLALILNYKTNFDNEWELPADYDYDKTMNLVGESGFYKTEEDVKNLKLEDFENTTSLKEVQLVTGKVNVTTNLLDGELIKAYDPSKTTEEEGWQKAETGEGGLYYKDIQVSCLVIAEDTYKDTITNVAEISEDKDEYGNDVTDRDSIPENKEDPYTTSQEDDDDYEPVILRYFDLALRKFITGVETNGQLTEVTSRVPVLSIDEESGDIKYTHPKEEAPVEVANNDIVIYTLRVYNEGTLAGYAEELTDDVPEGLIFLPEHEINKQYEWKMYDKDGEVTDSLEEINTIKTTYLSEEKETEDRDNEIKPYNSSKEISIEKPLNPDYRDVKVAFRVIETNTSDRVIVNSAQISEDSNDDDDSMPGEWNDGEDDQDKEYIYVKYFDLSLLKWVTQTIVTVDGKTTTTETGFKPNTGLTETTGIRNNKVNEPVAKVEIDKYKIDKTTVKFAYKIRVTNEGEISGYATEITDFIPTGLEFKAEDNKKYGWVKEGDNKVTTRALETVLLEPGESAELEIIFTWKNDKNNLGVKTNIAEITEDYNKYNSPDVDSTPENKKDPYEKEQEDDDDFALVVLSLKTGKGASYTILVMTVVTMLTTGIYLIKKYVLTY